MANHLFVSYKREENQFALKLAASLKNRGIGVWVDLLDIKPSDDWDDSIDKALKSSIGLIAVLTNEYLLSEYCRDELKFARNKGLTIFPILLRHVDEQNMRYWLSNLQYVDFTNWHNE